MKKAFLKCLAIATFALFSSTTFAQANISADQIVVTSGSISEAPNLLGAGVGVGPGLDVVIMNFLPEEFVYASVQTKIGTFEKQILGRLYFRVYDKDSTYPFDMVHVKLTNRSGQVFWERDIFRRSSISIYSAAFPLPQPADNYVRLEQYNK